MAELVQVELGQRSYPIYIGQNLRDRIAVAVAEDRSAGRPLVLITDANVAAAQSDLLDEVWSDVPRLVVPAGESTKCMQQLADCCEFLAAKKINRSGRLFAFGGGVIGDLAGFAAAAFLRGIDFYQVPTTLLAMVDSSVGGKTGINLAAGKNLVGAFHQPLAVFADTDCLQTLPPREFSAGMAEVIKHGLLADAELFDVLERGPTLSPSSPELAAIVGRNCRIKAGVVASDEREIAADGGRALLNLGHTFGHAIEAAAGYGTYLHGEAVAIGLGLATRLSVQLGFIDSACIDRVESLLQRYLLPVRLLQPLPIDNLLAAGERDKKVKAGRVRYVALSTIGRATTVPSVDPALIRDLWLFAGAR